MEKDVVIVGAGPAGSCLAISLARAGRSVLLLDGARFPRGKTCGEGIMPAGVAALEALGLAGRIAPIARPFDGIRYRLPDGTVAEASFPAGARGWGVDRRDLDARLLEAAREEPRVLVRLGAWVQRLDRGPDSVRVLVGGEPVTAQMVVGADGLRSFVRRAVGLEAPPPARERFGVGAHLRAALDPRDARVEVFVGAGFEVYTTPVGPETTCVALLVDRTGLARLRSSGLEQGMRRLLAEAGGRCARLARGELSGPVRAMGPLALGARAAHADRVLLVGDAAGALDPITGEGLALALSTTPIAARVLQRAWTQGDFSARSLAEWTRCRGAHLRGLAGLTRMVLHIAERPSRAARTVRALAACPATLERLVGVASGLAPLRSLTLRDGVRVLLGV